ncbi:MAG TPA: pyridoxal phosphate-dependent aminotransferase [Spirochaetota bacterium]|nr:pyridoxal phosphate-dependent aminotransferase [Spirochaetota bacterium]HOM38510.1 pyridoxal phosphate-dependent aminotransferase [Spirochaetota bacterium]HPQ49050.1 pyridoxal phosphate-dependent aminotransferase [Spirochaetota bacterium]
MISNRALKVEPSLTLGISSKAKEMKSKGIYVINFSAGEPDFDTPKVIKDSCKKALDEGKTKYAPVAGIPELRKAICNEYSKIGLNYDIKNVLVTVGAKEALFLAILAIVNSGDEVILPSPYWVSYKEMINIADGIAVTIDSGIEKDFKVSASDIEKAITPRTKAIIINSPSNPTGCVYTESELRDIAKVLEDKNIYIISDEIYDRLLYDGIKHFSIASASEKIKEKTILINGFSKSCSMTGWRLGYALGGKEIINYMERLQSHSTSGPATFIEYAAVESFNIDDEIEKMREEFEKRRDIMVDGLNNIKGIKSLKPKGAFYCFADIRYYIGKNIDGKLIKSSMDFAELLLEKAHVAVVPGLAFGIDGYMRLSFATSQEDIIEGIKRIKQIVEG